MQTVYMPDMQAMSNHIQNVDCVYARLPDMHAMSENIWNGDCVYARHAHNV